MKNTGIHTRQNRHTTTWRNLNIVLLLGMMLWGAASAYGQEITTLHILTPAWEDYTNEDGTGLWFEILRKVYEPVGITMTFDIVPWERARQKVIAHEADALLGEYEYDKLLMPRYHLDIETGSVVFKKDLTWDGKESLEGKKVVWLRGYDYHLASALEGVNFQWHEVDTPAQALKMLKSGRVDFYMDDGDDMDSYMEKNNFDMTLYRREICYTANLYVAFGKSKRSEKLIKMYDARIPELLESGDLQQLFEKWEFTFPSFEPEQ